MNGREYLTSMEPFDTAEKGYAFGYPWRLAANGVRASYYGAGEVAVHEKGGKWGFAVRASLADLSPRENTGETKRMVTCWYFGLERNFAGVTTDGTEKRVFRIGWWGRWLVGNGEFMIVVRAF